jgi:putative glutamine amidotransferase
MKKVFVTTDDKLVKDMFRGRGFEVVKNFFEPFDVICFTGGADINPFLYGERKMPQTEYDTRRDNLEIKYWKQLDTNFPKVGICRGAQLGNVLCGGSLWQDVDGHETQHTIKDFCFSTQENPLYLPASSVHHQMCILTDDALLYAAANRSTKKIADGATRLFGTQIPNRYDDPEAFWYGNFNFFGVQWHPEYYGYAACTKYFWQLFDATFPELKAVQTVPKRTLNL